jgi:hypothetical protein
VSKSTTTQCLFPDLLDKPLLVRFDAAHGSSDGGALLLKAANRRFGLVEAMSDCVVDLCLIKIGAHVEVSVRRILVHLQRSFAFLEAWRRVATVAARPG